MIATDSAHAATGVRIRKQLAAKADEMNAKRRETAVSIDA